MRKYNQRELRDLVRLGVALAPASTGSCFGKTENVLVKKPLAIQDTSAKNIGRRKLKSSPFQTERMLCM